MSDIRRVIVDTDPGIAQRRKALNINIEEPPTSPRNVASWYPNAVELTALLHFSDWP